MVGSGGSGMLSERRGEGYPRDTGVAFTALGGPILVKCLGLNLITLLVREGMVAVNLLSHHW